MNSTREQPLSNTQRRKRTQSTTITEAASRELRGLIIAALHLVFVSLLLNRPPSTGRRCCGGRATMTMHPANLGVGVPDGVVIRGMPGITGTEVDLLGGYCVETAWLDLSSWPLAALDQSQKSECARRHARGRRGLGKVMIEGSHEDGVQVWEKLCEARARIRDPSAMKVARFRRVVHANR
jgi:hypothetical protein